MTLRDRVVVITGGSRGIGRACVLQACGLGARVVFCSRQGGDSHRAVEAAAAAAGGAAVGAVADVAQEGDVARLFELARARFGGVDAVVSNAAVLRDDLLVSSTTEAWDAVIEANLTGGFLVIREAIRAFLQDGRRGRIVAIGSLSQRGVAGNASYAVAKGGLEGLVSDVARTYAPSGISACMVIPGYVDTALTAGMSDQARRTLIEGCPMRRSGSALEVASVVCHLLSDSAAALTGQSVLVAGGLREVPP